MTSTEAAKAPEGTIRRDDRLWWLAAAGVVAVIVSLVIGTKKYAGDASGHWTLSRANGLCASSAGQFAQLMNAQAGAKCSSIASLEQWRGWLMILGVAAIAAAVAWNFLRTRAR